ncbi:MAG: hypothetical protein ABI947_22055 [Chloroflexota bacterium]
MSVYPTSSNFIQRAYVGQLNVVGTAYCFGVAVHIDQETHKAVPVYLDMAGPATSVEAAWARLVQGKELTVVPAQAAAIYLQPPEAGLFRRYQRRFAELATDQITLVHQDAIEVPDEGLTFQIETSPEQAKVALGAHIRQLVKIALFPAWHDYLMQQGQAERLIYPCTCYGGVAVAAIHLDAARWTALIARGLEKKEIALCPA